MEKHLENFLAVRDFFSPSLDFSLIGQSFVQKGHLNQGNI